MTERSARESCAIVAYMKSTRHMLALCLAGLMGAVAGGCAAALCQPGEPSVNCCIKKFPLSPVESCAATEAEALEVLNGLRMAFEVVQNDGDTEDDFANNLHLPEWKQRCIRNYVDCKNEGWTGSCYACLRYCEGQRDWPFNKCRQRGKTPP
jgi:hypothetical protein